MDFQKKVFNRMISKKIILTFALLVGFSSHAHVDGNDLLAGIATGLFGRAVAYAAQQQGYKPTDAMTRAGAAIGLLTLAVQKHKQHGSLGGGFAQLTVALTTFLATMYIWPTSGTQVITTNGQVTTGNQLTTANQVNGTEDTGAAIWGPRTFIEVTG
jgi:hypothetical protein